MSAAQIQPSPEANKLQPLARLKKYDDLETALTEALESDRFSAFDLVSVFEVLAEQNQPEWTESIVWFALTMWTERQGFGAGLEVARALAGIYPQSETLRTETVELYRKAHHDKVPDFPIVLEMTLLRKTTPFSLAVQELDKLIDLLSRRYVLDTVTNVPGRVAGLDPAKKELLLTVTGQDKGFDPAACLKLQPLPDDDFRALAALEPERTAQLAEDDPAQLVLLALKTFGPVMKFRAFKEKVAPAVPNWSRWWADAKTKLARSAKIELSGGTQPTLTLLARPKSYENRLREQFAEAKTFEDQLTAILGYVSEHPADTPPDPGLIATFTRTLTQLMGSNEPVAKLAACAVMEELTAKFLSISTPPCPVEPPPDLSPLFGQFISDDLARSLLEYLRRKHPQEWYEIFTGVLPGASAGIADFLVGELVKEPVRDSLAHAVDPIIYWPDRFPRAVVWLYKATTSDKRPEFLASITQADVLTALLTAAQALKRKEIFPDAEYQRRCLTQIKNALSNDNFALGRVVMTSAGSDYLGYLRDTLPRNVGLGDAMSSDLLKILREIHPEMFVKSVPPWEEDATYTTQGALDRRNQDYAKLVNVDIPHNAKAIGEAADKGDLSENAEFTAALEERDRLTERATRMKAEIKKAKIIYHSMADTEFVTVGSRVKALNLDSNQEETYLFLGPWDADPPNRVLSYASPIAQAFMGKKAGETVEYTATDGPTRWKVLETAPGI